MDCKILPHQLRYVEGDTLPQLSGQITNDDGSPTNILGYTITLGINYHPEPAYITGQIKDAANGEYVIPLTQEDLRAGTWKFQVEYVDASGGVVTLNRHPETNQELELVVDQKI